MTSFDGKQPTCPSCGGGTMNFTENGKSYRACFDYFRGCRTKIEQETSRHIEEIAPPTHLAPGTVLRRSVRVKCPRGCIRQYTNVEEGREYFFCCGNTAEVLSDRLVESDGGSLKTVKVAPKPQSRPRLRGRVTRCWACGQGLTSMTDRKCEDCGWLICSCGACSTDC